MATEAEVKAWAAESRKVRVTLSPGVTVDGFVTEFVPAKAMVQLDSGSHMTAALDAVAVLTDEQANTEVEKDILEALGGGAEARAILTKLIAADIEFTKKTKGLTWESTVSTRRTG